jgi:hypothetical protein
MSTAQQGSELQCDLEHERPARHVAVLEEAGKRRADWKVASRLAKTGKLVLGSGVRGAQEELDYLEDWLSRLQREHPAPSRGLSQAGLRKMIARLHEELAFYEGSQEVKSVK